MRITLNRPDVLNSFNRAMANALQQVLDTCSRTAEVRAILITGAGRAFCAGQDLSEVSPAADGSLPDLGEIVHECYNPIILAVRNLEKPVVCAVNGVAAGAGANLAYACDIVIAARNASFVQSFSKVGLIPDSGGTFFLPRLAGMGRAAALCMLAEKLSAEEAQRIGLIYRVCEAEELEAQSMKIAVELASMPTRGIGFLKRALNNSYSSSLEDQLNLEARLQGDAGRSEDYREGVQAFLEKRKPVFQGK